jgi:hypothetical protein
VSGKLELLQCARNHGGLGTQGLVQLQQEVNTFLSCSGQGRKDVPGIKTDALQQLEVATLSCCSGVQGMGGLGADPPAQQQVRVNI